MIVVAVLGAAAVAVGVRLLLRRRAAGSAPPVVEPSPAPENAWFAASVAGDTDTPPMGIPTSAPERLPSAPPPAPAPALAPALAPAAASATPRPFAGAVAALPVVARPVPGPYDPSAEATDPGLRLPPPGYGSAEATDRIPVATLLGAAPRPPGAVPRPEPVPAPPVHRWGLGAYLLAELVFLVVSALVGLLLVGDGPVPPWALAVAVGVPTLTAAGVALVITRVRGNGPVVDLHLRGGWSDIGMGLAFGFGGLFLSLPASYAYVALVGEDASSAVGDIFGGVTTSAPVALLIALTVVLIAPLCEEILYRGLLWGGLTRLGANRWLAFGVTTVIFALAHFEWPRALLLLVVAIPIGLARVYTGGLIAPIVAHQVNNLLPGIGLYLMLTGAFPVL